MLVRLEREGEGEALVGSCALSWRVRRIGGGMGDCWVGVVVVGGGVWCERECERMGRDWEVVLRRVSDLGGGGVVRKGEMGWKAMDPYTASNASRFWVVS